MENPYSPWRVDLSLFYGRNELADMLISDLAAARSCAIIGGRRIGKTTLLRFLERHFLRKIENPTEKGYLIIPVYMDMLAFNMVQGPLPIYKTILQEVMKL